MKSTVDQGFTQKGELPAAVERMLAQMRAGLNQVGRFGPLPLTTGSAATGTVWTSDVDIPLNSCWSVTANVQSFELTAPSTNSVRIIREAYFVRGTGAAVLVAQADTAPAVNAGSGSAAFALVGSKMSLALTTIGALTQSWFAWIEVRGATA